MSVRIENINIDNLGPLHELQLELGAMNLIYGRNETGKTLLVEFLLKSLFSHAQDWSLRNTGGEGKIKISGLQPDLVEFTPLSEIKLEHFWEEADRGFPLNLAQLLVVKGGEVNISSESAAGISKQDLKTILTRESLLDDILGRIQITVQKSTLVDGEIIGENRGEIKDRSRLERDCQRLTKLMENVDSRFSRGPLQELTQELDLVQKQLQQQHEAKNHQAYLLSQQIDDLEEQKAALPERELEVLGKNLTSYFNLEDDLENLSSQADQLKQHSINYKWLQQALSTWQELQLEKMQPPYAPIAAAGILFLSLGLILLIVSQFAAREILSWSSSALIFLGAVLSWYHTRKLSSWANQQGEFKERTAIKQRYQELFQKELSGVTDIKQSLESLQELHFRHQALLDQVQDKKNQQDQLARQIQTSFSSLAEPGISPSGWESTHRKMRDTANQLQKQLFTLTAELSSLGVAEQDFRADPAPVSFSIQILSDLEEQEAELLQKQDQILQDFERLKQRVCTETGDSIDTSWDVLLTNLQELHHETFQSYRNLTARIIAGIGLTDIISKIRKEEDQRIRDHINTDFFSRLIKSITGSQQSIDLINGEFIARGNYRDTPLRDLSTGTREQIQLALRMGLASHVTGGEEMFLILDDAFQHSDWNRREQLVDQALQLVLSGWQIIYLTMDDHLRDLITAKSQASLKDDFFSCKLQD